MELRLERKWKKPDYTVGVLYVDGARFSETMEDADMGLTDSMSEAEIGSKKVYGRTAIPKGRYEVRLTWSPKFHGKAWCRKYSGRCPQVMGVKGFQGIRIHPLNTAEDSLGCIGVGENKEKGKILNSTAFFTRLMDSHIVPASDKGEKIELVIK